MNCVRCNYISDENLRSSGSNFCRICLMTYILEEVNKWNIDIKNPNPNKCGGVDCDQSKCREYARRRRGLI